MAAFAKKEKWFSVDGRTTPAIIARSSVPTLLPRSLDGQSHYSGACRGDDFSAADAAAAANVARSAMMRRKINQWDGGESSHDECCHFNEAVRCRLVVARSLESIH